jgi:UDP-3-O-[3-hydroxymyristoyl] N-acetylglucosamine deacetylase
MRRQRTFRHVIGCVGVGLHSGARVGLTLRPAEAGTGVRFRRADRPGTAAIPARLDHLREGPSGAGLGAGGTPTVRAVEHLMAALLACEIDNALVEISGPELPLMDGSARPFVLLIECAGTVEQDAPVAQLELLRPIAVAEEGRQARLEPAAGLHLAMDDVATPTRSFAFSFSPEACKRELVAAREPGCLGNGDGNLDPRFADEPARHAALDALGDLALMPARLHARYVGTAADAALRRRLLRRLLRERDAWRLTGPAPPWPPAEHATTTYPLAC